MGLAPQFAQAGATPAPETAVQDAAGRAAVIALQPLAPGLWWLPATRGEPDAGNGGVTVQALVLREGRRVWLVGSGPTPAYGAALARAVRRTVGAAVTDIVNTRAAPELAMGNVAFRGARLWALADVAQQMRQRCGSCQARLREQIGAVAGASLQPGSIRAPQRPVGGVAQASGRLGPFDWRAYERGAGERVQVLRLPRQRVALAQGLLWVGDLPDLRHTDSPRLLAAWAELQAWTAGDRVLGEQGGIADAQAFAAHAAYVQDLRALIAPALQRGEVWGAQPLDAAAWSALPGYAQRHPLNAQHLWLELERELFR